MLIESCTRTPVAAKNLLNPCPYYKLTYQLLTLAIRSVGSLKGSLFQFTFSARSPFKLTMPFSQLAQSTGPTYFLVNIASSSIG
jgi:hypothetical protein